MLFPLSCLAVGVLPDEQLVDLRREGSAARVDVEIAIVVEVRYGQRVEVLPRK